MGGDGFNNLHKIIRRDAVINPDINDLLPVNQVQDFQLLEKVKEHTFTSLLKKLLKPVSVLLITIFATLALLYLSNYQNEPNYCTVNYKDHKQINLNKRNIRVVRRKVMKLNKGIEQLIQCGSNKTTKANESDFDTLLELEDRIINEIDKALRLYDADKVGMIDYALESAGGLITSTPDTVSFPSHHSYNVLGLITLPYPSNPRILIQPGNLPGECYAFKGDKGKIRIRLTDIIQITAVTIEYTHPNLVQNRYSAPKDFRVYGLETARAENGYELGVFTYKVNDKPIQTFYVKKMNKVFEHVELNIATNHGNPAYTCIYRFRVHGKIVNENGNYRYY